MKRAYIFSGGNYSKVSSLVKIKKGDYVFCADSGADLAIQYGFTPNILFGDMDSISKNTMSLIQSKGNKIRSYPTDKDKSDFEIVIDYAINHHFTDLNILGFFGSRIDHMISSLMLLVEIKKNYPHIKIKIIEENQIIYLINSDILIRGKVGDTVSLAPFTDCEKVTLQGFKYPLKEAFLPCGTTLGISNLLNLHTGKIFLQKGLLMVTHFYKGLQDINMIQSLK